MWQVGGSQDGSVKAEQMKNHFEKLFRPRKRLQDISDAWKMLTTIKTALLSLTCEVDSRILLQLISAVDEIMRQEQAGFRNKPDHVQITYVLDKSLQNPMNVIKSLYENFAMLEDTEK